MQTGYEGKSFYELLGVARNASEAEIQRAYNEIARVFDPQSAYYNDISKEPPSERDREIFQLVQEAFATLHDADRRAEYDKALAEAERVALIREQERRRVLAEQQRAPAGTASEAAVSQGAQLPAVRVEGEEGPEERTVLWNREIDQDPPSLLELWGDRWTLFDKFLLFCAVGLPILTILTAIIVWILFLPERR